MSKDINLYVLKNEYGTFTFSSYEEAIKYAKQTKTQYWQILKWYLCNQDLSRCVLIEEIYIKNNKIKECRNYFCG